MQPVSKFKETEIGLIPEDWEVGRIGDFVDIKHGFAFKGGYFSDEPTEYVLLTPGNFKIGGGFKEGKLKYTNEIPAAEYVLNKNDIIVTMTDLSKEGDTLGYSAKLPDSKDKKYLHNQRIGLLKFKSKEISSDFIYWTLRTKRYHSTIGGSATGSTVKHTSPGRIKQYNFCFPKQLFEQTIIAHILSSLEDKIELNAQMNATLEEIAQTLFKRWFVDFEFPDEKGKPYKSSGGKMVETELGDIPEGWVIKTIRDVVETKGGTTPSTDNKEYWENGQINWCTPKDLSRLSSPVLLETDRKITKSGLSYISSGLLPPGVLLLSSRAPIGYVVISQIPVSINQGFIAIICNKVVSNYFMLFWTKQNMASIKSMAHGTTFEEINKASFRSMKFILPSQEIQKNFDKISRSIYSQLVKNEEESQHLIRIRDFLLPRLLSGRIRTTM